MRMLGKKQSHKILKGGGGAEGKVQNREAQTTGGRTKSETGSFDCKNKALSSDICILVCGPGSFIYCKVLRNPSV